MRAAMFFAFFALFSAGPAYAGSGKSICSEAASKVSVAYVGEKLAEDRETRILYGIFEVKNSGSRALTIPLDSADSPLMIQIGRAHV